MHRLFGLRQSLLLLEGRFLLNDATASTPIINVLRSLSKDYIPSIVPTLGWFLCPPIHWKPSKIKAPSLSLFLFLCCSIRPPQMMGKRPPLHVPPCRIASPTTILHRNHRSVGCCVPSSNGSHPRPMLRPSLNFSLGAIGALQSRDSAAASLSSCAGHLK